MRPDLSLYRDIEMACTKYYEKLQQLWPASIRSELKLLTKMHGLFSLPKVESKALVKVPIFFPWMAVERREWLKGGLGFVVLLTFI